MGWLNLAGPGSLRQTASVLKDINDRARNATAIVTDQVADYWTHHAADETGEKADHNAVAEKVGGPG